MFHPFQIYIIYFSFFKIYFSLGQETCWHTPTWGFRKKKYHRTYIKMIEIIKTISSGKIGPRTIGPRTVGPGTTGPWGPTVLGPICHFSRADWWAPDNWAPGPNLPLFKGGQLGPGQLGPEPNWYLPRCFWWFMNTFCTSRWHLNVWDGVHCIFDFAYMGLGWSMLYSGWFILYSVQWIWYFGRKYHFWG